jgi:hypothetical protein
MDTIGETEMPKPFTTPSVWIILGPVLLIAIFSVLMAVFVRPGEKPPEEGWSGPFYSNPDDSALWVPKRYGIGYTLNFGNPWCWIVVALLLAMLAVPLVLAAMHIHQLPR